MRTSRYSTSRQKACQQCSGAKVRCDRKTGNERCTRCTQRGLPCAYPHADVPEAQTMTTPELNGVQPPSPFSISDMSFASPEMGLLATNMSNDPITRLPKTPSTTSSRPLPLEDEGFVNTVPRMPESLDDMNFSGLDLVCPISADEIKNRWIQAYIPVPGQTVKQYPTGVSKFIYRILKSYAAVAVNGRGILPFIHPKQMVAQPAGSPLTTCLSLVRICSNPMPGTEDTAVNVLQREMHNVYKIRDKYDDKFLFAAFQAHLIYSMILFFQLNHACNDHFRGIMTNLQELACASSQQGLLCASDQRRARPRWEEWITVEAKRRTLFVMYLFDSILSTKEGLPTFLGTELQGLPAPASKLLWQTNSRFEWERQYNIHMAEWMEGSLTIDELWPPFLGMSASDVSRRHTRVNRWLENLDEYGTMLYAIMRCTHSD